MRGASIGIGALILAMTAGTAPSNAEPRPWCLQRSTYDCTYYTLAQCRASGGHGSAPCIENPAIAWDAIRRGKSRAGLKVPPAPSRSSGFRRFILSLTGATRVMLSAIWNPLALHPKSRTEVCQPLTISFSSLPEALGFAGAQLHNQRFAPDEISQCRKHRRR